MKISEKILKFRSDRGLTQEQLAKMGEVSNKSVSAWESGSRSPKVGALQKICSFYSVDIARFIDEASDYYGQENVPDKNGCARFPVLGDVAAGYDHIAIEEWDGDTIDVPTSYLRGKMPSSFFALRVDGDSMFPTYQDGDIVLVLRQETMNRSGEIGVVIYDDDKATLKRVEYFMGENWMKLSPVNPQYPPIMVKDEGLEHCRVLGVPQVLIRRITE